MPDQPDDPIHYEMKIPPETKQSKHEHESEKLRKTLMLCAATTSLNQHGIRDR
jgi:hypothetical protein